MGKKWLLAFVAILALAGLVWVSRELYRPYRGYAGNLVLAIQPGTQAPVLAKLLVSRGVLAHHLPFLVVYGLGRPRHRTIKSGEYLFDRPLRPVDVYQKLVQGDIYTRLVVIPEGSDRFDMARILHQRLGIKPEEFLAVAQQTSPIRDLDPMAPSLEGYLFPDTYRFPQGASSATVVLTMLARFRQILDSKFRQDLSQSSGGLHDVITLASLVEKETPDPAERPLVAEVFVRRLDKGILLQCDPTVVYADRLSHHLIGRPVGLITQSDLQIDSLYNTYRYPGLPPGPICSPGEASIRAALKPASGAALYFVSNNHGGHVFASTLEEHQRNVTRYRKEVAAHRHVALNGGEVAVQPSSHRGRERIDAKTRSTKGARHQKQKTTHPGILRGTGLGTGRGAGDPGYPG